MLKKQTNKCTCSRDNQHIYMYSVHVYVHVYTCTCTFLRLLFEHNFVSIQAQLSLSVKKINSSITLSDKKNKHRDVLNISADYLYYFTTLVCLPFSTAVPTSLSNLSNYHFIHVLALQLRPTTNLGLPRGMSCFSFNSIKFFFLMKEKEAWNLATPLRHTHCSMKVVRSLPDTVKISFMNCTVRRNS